MITAILSDIILILQNGGNIDYLGLGILTIKARGRGGVGQINVVGDSKKITTTPLHT